MAQHFFVEQELGIWMRLGAAEWFAGTEQADSTTTGMMKHYVALRRRHQREKELRIPREFLTVWLGNNRHESVHTISPRCRSRSVSKSAAHFAC